MAGVSSIATVCRINCSIELTSFEGRAGELESCVSLGLLPSSARIIHPSLRFSVAMIFWPFPAFLNGRELHDAITEVAPLTYVSGAVLQCFCNQLDSFTD